MKNTIIKEPVMILLSIVLGFLVSFFLRVSDAVAVLEDPLVILLLYFIFLEVNFTKLKGEYTHKRFILTTLAVNFIWTPILAFILAKTLLLDSQELQIALVMLLVMPCTDWYLIFTDLTGGNVTLSSAMLPINLLLQLILLPIYLYLIFQTQSITIDNEVIFETILEIAIPFILALLTQKFVFKEGKLPKLKKSLDFLAHHAELVLICLIAFVIYAAEGQEFLRSPLLYPVLFIAILLFYIINFILSLILAHFLQLDDPDTISLTYLITARNTPLALTLATILFVNKPIIVLALLIGPLTELPFSAIESLLLKKVLPKKRMLDLNRKE